MKLEQDMKVKQETKVEAEMVEFVIRHSDNKVWISIESMVKNKVIENAFKIELRKEEVSKVCANICEEIDAIFDIDRNKKQLINIINTTSKGEKKLSLMTISMASYREFDEFGNETKCEPQIVIEANKTQLPYFDVNNEFSRLVNYIYDNKQKLVELGSILYFAGNEAYHIYQKSLKSKIKSL